MILNHFNRGMTLEYRQMIIIIISLRNMQISVIFRFSTRFSKL